MKRTKISSTNFRSELAAAHRAKADQVRGATLKIFALKADGTPRAKPFDDRLRTENEAELQIAYWTKLNPHLSFIAI